MGWHKREGDIAAARAAGLLLRPWLKAIEGNAGAIRKQLTTGQAEEVVGSGVVWSTPHVLDPVARDGNQTGASPIALDVQGARNTHQHIVRPFPGEALSRRRAQDGDATTV